MELVVYVLLGVTSVVGLTFTARLRGQIELLCFKPSRPTRDLLGMNPVGEGHQIVEGRIDRGGKRHWQDDDGG